MFFTWVNIIRKIYEKGTMSLDFLTLFFSFLSAFIVKDFYDIFISKHIRKFFKIVDKKRKDFL